METTKESGDRGETLAARYLTEQGFTVVERNWRFGRDEVDLIVRKGAFLHFVEVKLRSSAWAGDPSVFVNKRKQQAIVRAADFYLRNKDTQDSEARFDIVAIVDHPGAPSFEHIENAFYAML